MLAFDIDGVVADIGYYCALSVSEYFNCHIDDVDMTSHDIKIKNRPDIEQCYITNAANRCVIDYVLDIRPFPGAIQFLKEYSKRTSDKLLFITARSYSETSNATYAWLNEYLSGYRFEVVFTSDKIEYIKAHPEITGLVEDRFKTSNLASKHVTSYLVNRPWNTGRSAERNVLRINSLQDIWFHIV